MAPRARSDPRSPTVWAWVSAEMERKSASPPSGSTRRDLPQRCGAESTAAKIYGSPVLADEDAAVFASECRKYPSDRSTRGVGVFEAAHPTSLRCRRFRRGSGEAQLTVEDHAACYRAFSRDGGGEQAGGLLRAPALPALARYFKHWFGATRATGGGGNSTAGGRGVGVFAAPHPTSLVDAADVFGADPEKPNSPSRITPPATAPSRATAEANVPAASGRSATGTSAAGIGPAAFGVTRATGAGNNTAGGRGVGVFKASHPTSLVDAADVFRVDPEKPNSPSRITPLATAPSRATAEANAPAASGRSAMGTSATGVRPAAFSASRATAAAGCGLGGAAPGTGTHTHHGGPSRSGVPGRGGGEHGHGGGGVQGGQGHNGGGGARGNGYEYRFQFVTTGAGMNWNPLDICLWA
ncbi:PE-PGRS family protein PE_PGRS5-like [Panicum virgatum]|uniref:PE-PGRS family protein PE_PGRS5-like n=1 Tax=Panicum virgatum TaxID=38727 RepID=UPI0019D5122C|nr:PE-PGRS family protein PE_PGRS5-like [Panicum virgatum]